MEQKDEFKTLRHMDRKGTRVPTPPLIKIRFGTSHEELPLLYEICI